MKKLSVLVILLLAMCLSFGTITTVAAEELPSTEQTQEIPNLPSTDDVINGSKLAEEDKELIKDLVNKVKEYTNNSDSFFVRYIVPLLVAGALCVLVSIILILPIFKNKTENKTLKGMLKNAKTQIEELKKEGENLKALINANNVQEQVKAVVKKEMANMSKMVEDTLVKGGVEEPTFSTYPIS